VTARQSSFPESSQKKTANARRCALPCRAPEAGPVTGSGEKINPNRVQANPGPVLLIDGNRESKEA